jgi:glycosyltransferase involved in cell wall biosynthesis
MPGRLSVLALVPYALDASPSQRFRIEQWQPALEADGIDLTLEPFVDRELLAILHQPGQRVEKALRGSAALVRRLADVASARRFDAIVVHRAAALFGPALLERLIVLMRRPILYDFDDAIYLLHTSEANRAIGWLKFPGKTQALCRMSRGVVVANEGLAEYARRYNPNVHMVPSSVDTQRFRPPAGPREPGPMRVGWTGSSTSLTYLEMFEPVLGEMLARLPVELHVHSDREPALRVPFRFHPWRPDTEADELSRLDVGIMPMPEDAWARGKSAMKALLYMAMGIPTVATGVGTNRDVIRSGENGLLVRTPEEWLGAIEKLAASPGERARLGGAGRRTVEEHYSKDVCAALFAKAVRSVVA